MRTVYTENYTGVISPKDAFFESNEYGEDDSVTMYFEGKTVTDYDHCYEIPSEVQKVMTNLGYNLKEVV